MSRRDEQQTAGAVVRLIQVADSIQTNGGPETLKFLSFRQNVEVIGVLTRVWGMTGIEMLYDVSREQAYCAATQLLEELALLTKDSHVGKYRAALCLMFPENTLAR